MCIRDRGVYLTHPRLRSIARPSKVTLEHVGDIGHQIDRVVPHDRHPGIVTSGFDDDVGGALLLRGHPTRVGAGITVHGVGTARQSSEDPSEPYAESRISLHAGQTGNFLGSRPGVHTLPHLSLIHISEPTRRTPISYAVFCLKKKTHKQY